MDTEVATRTALQSLSLFSPELPARWSGVPVHWVGTPEGTWAHRFTPPTTTLTLVARGNLSADLSCQGRRAAVDVGEGAFAIFEADREVRADQRGCSGAKRILVELDIPTLIRSGLLDDDLATA